MTPSDRAKLTASLPGGHREPDDRSPVWVLEGLVHDARRLSGRWRSWIALRRRRRLCISDRIDRDPLQLDRPAKSSTNDEVHLPDGGCGKGHAHMRPTTLITHVIPGRPVVDQSSRSIAVMPTPSQLGIERLHDSCVQRRELLRAEQWADVLLGIPLVCVERVVLEVGVLEVAFEQLVDSRVGAGVPTLVDVVEEPHPRLFSQARGLRASRNHLNEIMPTLGDGIGSCVDANAQRPARQRVDRPALPPSTPGPCHRRTVSAT